MGFNNGNGIINAGGGGGGTVTAALAYPAVGYGDVTNQLTGSPLDFYYDLATPMFNVAFNNGASVMQISDVTQIVGIYYGAKLDASAFFATDQSLNQATAGSVKGVIINSFTFTGTGLNDLSVVNPNLYQGLNGTTYTVTIDGVGTIAVLGLSSITITPSFGDIIHGVTTGATGIVVLTDIINSFFYIKITSGNFTGETSVLDVTTGRTSIVNSVVNGTDTFSWTDGTNSESLVPIPLPPKISILANASEISFASASGHTLGDSWDFTYNYNFGRSLFLDGSSKIYAFGDVDSVYSGAQFNILETSASTFTATIADVHGAVFSMDTLNGAYAFGDINGNVNNTYLFIDDVSGYFSVVTQTAFIGRPNNIASGVEGSIVVGDISTGLGTIKGSFNQIVNSNNGDIAFSGTGDLSPFGLSTEATVLGHITPTGDYAVSYCDVDSGTGYSFYNATAALAAGQSFNINLKPTQLLLQGSAGTGILIDDSTSLITLFGVPAYADNAAAIAAGLTTGNLFKTTLSGSTYVKIVP